MGELQARPTVVPPIAPGTLDGQADSRTPRPNDARSPGPTEAAAIHETRHLANGEVHDAVLEPVDRGRDQGRWTPVTGLEGDG